MALTASPEIQAHLLELQALDTKLRQLDHRTKNLPETAQLVTLDSDLVALRAERATASGALDDARLELSRIESDVAVVETRIARDVERLQASSSVKDVAGLESELSGLRKRQLDLEEIELSVMEKVEALESAAAQLDAASRIIEAKVKDVAAARDASLGSVTSERQHAAANRATIASGLPAELLALYERQLSRYGSGASLLQGGVSSASGVKLTESDMAVIRTAAPDAVLLCPDSNAILVRTAQSGL